MAVPTIDHGRAIDWGRTSDDYARYRQGPPASFFARLKALEVGVAGQRILDLATGTGLMAREFARHRARVTGIDISPDQIATARRLAREEHLDIAFAVAPAEATGMPDAAFDAVTANQCWLYFDRDRAVAEVKRVLAPGGVLVTSHFAWLPLQDPIAALSEATVLEFNPHWTAHGFAGNIPPVPRWVRDDFDLVAMFWYDVAMPYTREAWRGRMRASRGVGASMTPGDIARFDAALDARLRAAAGDTFTVLHRLDAHFLRPKGD